MKFFSLFYILLCIVLFVPAAQAERITNQSIIDAVVATGDLTSPGGGSPTGQTGNSTTAARAFDNNITQGGRMMVQDKDLWVTYTFDTAQVVNAYSVQYVSGGYDAEPKALTRSPKNFALYGTNDDLSSETVNWELLDEEKDQSIWTVSEIRYYSANVSSVPYKSYKWICTASQGDTWRTIGDLEFFKASVISPVPCKITVTEDPNGSVEQDKTEAKSGEEVSLTAIPNEGYRFYKWTSSMSLEDDKANPLTFTVSGDVTLKPIFIPADMNDLVVYVATDGSDSADGFSKESPKATIGAAVSVLNEFGEGKVLVSEGEYSIQASISLSNAISVIGESDYTKVIVTNAKEAGWDNKDQRVFKLNHAGAGVYNLTISGGWVEQAQGSNIYIFSGGGTVSNCVIEAGYSKNYDAGAAVVLESEKALVTHCEIMKNHIQQDHNNKGVVAVHVLKGRLENSFIHDNNSSEAGHAIVRANGAGCSVVNCTIVNNYAKTAVGLWAGKDAEIKNNVVFNCTKDVTVSSEDGTTTTGRAISPYSGAQANVVACATDGETPINETCRLITDADFKDYANGNFTPSFDSILRDNGAEVSLLSTTDFAGADRVQGSRIDIGCYEALPSGTIILIL